MLIDFTVFKRYDMLVQYVQYVVPVVYGQLLPMVKEVGMVPKSSPVQSPGPAVKNVGGVNEATVLSPPTTFIAEVSKAPNPQLLPKYH